MPPNETYNVKVEIPHTYNVEFRPVWDPNEDGTIDLAIDVVSVEDDTTGDDVEYTNLPGPVKVRIREACVQALPNR